MATWCFCLGWKLGLRIDMWLCDVEGHQMPDPASTLGGSDLKGHNKPHSDAQVTKLPIAIPAEYKFYFYPDSIYEKLDVEAWSYPGYEDA